MKLKFILLLIWFISSSVFKTAEPRTVFGVQISFQANSTLYRLQVFIDNGRVLSKQKYLSRDEFIKYASGFWPSIYNPKKLNFFEQNNIETCGVFEDPELLEKIPYCFPLDSLWKVKWNDAPFQSTVEKGWANGLYRPSLKQQKYLHDNYGVENIELGFFLDTNFWKIMRDVQDLEWIQKYKSL